MILRDGKDSARRITIVLRTHNFDHSSIGRIAAIALGRPDIFDIGIPDSREGTMVFRRIYGRVIKTNGPSRRALENV